MLKPSVDIRTAFTLGRVFASQYLLAMLKILLRAVLLCNCGALLSRRGCDREKHSSHLCFVGTCIMSDPHALRRVHDEVRVTLRHQAQELGTHESILRDWEASEALIEQKHNLQKLQRPAIQPMGRAVSSRHPTLPESWWASRTPKLTAPYNLGSDRVQYVP